jgi:heat shock protein HslJ
MKDEGLFFRMLKKVKTFKVDKKVLSLLDKDGEEVLKAVKTK